MKALNNVEINLEELNQSKLSKLEETLYSGNAGERRPYQRRILLKTVLLAQDHASDSVLIQSPTGSGKTFMGLTLADYLQNKTDLFGKKPKVAWVSMRSNLRTQAERDRVKFGIDCQIDYVSQFDKNPDQYDVVIFDEAHHAPCASGQNIVHKTKAKFVIGLTATPIRRDKASLLFKHYLTDANIKELVRDNYLSKFDIGIIPDYEVATIAESYLSKKEEFGKTVFFMKSYEEMIDLANILSENEVSFHIVTSKNGDSEATREAQIKDFKEGKVQVLINQFILTEGFDDDSLKTVFVRDSTKSCVVQMAGRVLRKNDSVGRKYIIQSLNTKALFSNVANPVEKLGFVDGQWIKKATMKNLIAVIKKSIKIRVQSALSKAKQEEAKVKEINALKEYKKQKDIFNMKKKNERLVIDFRKKYELFSEYGIVPHYVRVDIEGQIFLLSFKYNRIHTLDSGMGGVTTVKAKEDFLENNKEAILKAYKKEAENYSKIKDIKKAGSKEKTKSQESNPFMRCYEENKHLDAATLSIQNLGSGN